MVKRVKITNQTKIKFRNENLKARMITQQRTCDNPKRSIINQRIKQSLQSENIPNGYIRGRNPKLILTHENSR